MDFEWDEAKRRANIEKHALDFRDIDLLFAGPFLAGAAKTVAGEARNLAIGLVDDVCVTVIYTSRAGVLRIISMRKARRNERRRYQEIFGG